MPTKQVLIGGLALHGEDRAGQWVVEELEGWYEPPAPKGTTSERVNGHGEIDVPDYYGARTPTVSGILFHKGRGLAVSAMERLSANMSLEAKKLVVTDAGLSRWANAKLAGLDWTEVTRGTMRFQARFKCVDPFKYGESRSFSAAVGSPVDVFHRGTVPAWPVVTVTGSMPEGYELTLGGQLVEVTKGLASGSTHTIDMRTGILRENGSRVYGSIGIAEYFMVKPGSRQSFYSVAASGSGTATVRFNDTYI